MLKCEFLFDVLIQKNTAEVVANLARNCIAGASLLAIGNVKLALMNATRAVDPHEGKAVVRIEQSWFAGRAA